VVIVDSPLSLSLLPVKRECLHQSGREPLVKDERPLLLEHLRRSVHNALVRVGRAAASLGEWNRKKERECHRKGGKG